MLSSNLERSSSCMLPPFDMNFFTSAAIVSCAMTSLAASCAGAALSRTAWRATFVWQPVG